MSNLFPKLIEDYSDPGDLDTRDHWHRLEFTPTPDIAGDLPGSLSYPGSVGGEDSEPESVFASQENVVFSPEMYIVLTTGHTLFLSEEQLLDHIAKKTFLGEELSKLMS